MFVLSILILKITRFSVGVFLFSRVFRNKAPETCLSAHFVCCCYSQQCHRNYHLGV